MSERRFWFGVAASIFWLAVASLLFYVSDSKAATMKANEWGDFFAGIFAPLAFLWLVLGYLQQGEELRLSSAALHLQAEELRNSVEQQRHLVEVTRQQVEGEREALQFERQQRDQQARPHFVLTPEGASFHDGGRSRYLLILANTGSTAVALLVDVVPPQQQPFRAINAPLFERGQQQRIELTTVGPLAHPGAQVTLTFRDTLNRDHGQVFVVARETDDPRSELVARRIEA